MGIAPDGTPSGCRVTFYGVAGPVIDPERMSGPNGAPPKLDANGEPALCEEFTGLILIRDHYPFAAPEWFYEAPIPCHPNVNPVAGVASLFWRWRATCRLVDAVERFIAQISYLGFGQQEAPGMRGPGWVHVLNTAALEWALAYGR